MSQYTQKTDGANMDAVLCFTAGVVFGTLLCCLCIRTAYRNGVEDGKWERRSIHDDTEDKVEPWQDPDFWKRR